MSAALDLTGRQFGRLTAIRHDGFRASGGKKLWLCVCSCGSPTGLLEVRQDNLRGGAVKSCGCLRDESLRNVARTHGLHGSPTYTSWLSMRQRCTYPRAVGFKNYGAKGVKVCGRWLKFENFLADMGERPSKAHVLSRKGDAGNYEPGNVVWALRAANHREMLDRRAEQEA